MSFARRSIPAMAALLLCACSGSSEETEKVEEKPLSVRVARVGTGDISSWVYAQGTSRARRREYLTFENGGRVAYLDPRLQEGSPVRAGQLIAYQVQARPEANAANARAGLAGARSDVTVARAALREANANLELARETFERFAQLLRLESASEQEYDEAEAKLAQARAGQARAEAQLASARAQVGAASAGVDEAEVGVAESRLVSPINGVFGRLNIEQGRYFTPQIVQTQSEAGALSTVPVVVIDPSSYEIRVELPAFERGSVVVGDRVLIVPDDGIASSGAASTGSDRPGSARAPTRALADAAVPGRVIAVSPSLDPERRAFKVTIRNSAGATRLQDGEFVTVWIEGRAADDTVVIPYRAIRFEDNNPFVFVYDAKTGTALRRSVQTGLQGIGGIEIRSGLKAGTPIIVEGAERLFDGDRVKPIEKRPGNAAAKAGNAPAAANGATGGEGE